MIVLAAAVSDNPLNTLAIIGGLISPFLGIGAGILASWLSRRTGREQTTVAADAVKVDEKQAHTAEIAMIIDGFTAALNAAETTLRRKGEELDAARSEMQTVTDKLTIALGDNADLRRRVVAYGKQLREMLLHIFSLEQMVPNPPGPPSRPDWDPWPAEFEDTDNPNRP